MYICHVSKLATTAHVTEILVSIKKSRDTMTKVQI